MVSPRARQSSIEADKDVTTPFLVRCFVTSKTHTPIQDFDDGLFPLRDEYQVYAWKDDTLPHLLSLLLPSMPPSHRSPLARFHVRMIYADTAAHSRDNGRRPSLYKYKDLATITGKDLVRSKGDDKSLDTYRFVTGDHLSIAISAPEPRAGPGVPAGGRQSFGWGGANGAQQDGPGLSIRGRGGARPSFGHRDGPEIEPAGGGNWRGRGRGGGPPAGAVGGREREVARGGGARRRTPSPLRERERERERNRSASPRRIRD